MVISGDRFGSPGMMYYHRVENKNGRICPWKHWSTEIYGNIDLWITKQVYSRWCNSYELIIAYLYEYRNFNTTKNGQISWTQPWSPLHTRKKTSFGVSFRWISRESLPKPPVGSCFGTWVEGWKFGRRCRFWDKGEGKCMEFFNVYWTFFFICSFGIF